MLTRYILFSLGCVSLLLGFAGLFLPLIPTTPFVLLSAYCFARSSEKLYAWLLSLKFAGPLIRDWEEHGVISKKAKLFSSVGMLVLISFPLIFGSFEIYWKLLAASIMLAVLLFIWTRPSYIS